MVVLTLQTWCSCICSPKGSRVAHNFSFRRLHQYSQCHHVVKYDVKCSIFAVAKLALRTQHVTNSWHVGGATNSHGRYASRAHDRWLHCPASDHNRGPMHNSAPFGNIYRDTMQTKSAVEKRQCANCWRALARQSDSLYRSQRAVPLLRTKSAVEGRQC